MSLIAIRGGLSDPVTPERLARLSELLPERQPVVIRDDNELQRRAEEVGVCFGKVPPEFVAAASNLRWLQWDAAGVNQIVPAVREVVAGGRQVALTNASGIHAIPLTEHLLALMLAFARRLDYSFRLQAEGGWKGSDFPAVFELSGKQVVLLGVGAIGSAFAPKAAALGMQVVGVRRDATKHHAFLGETVSVERLHEVLPSADFVVVTLPYTTETAGIIGAPELALMRNSAYLINIGRGGIVDEAALLDALEAGPEGGGIAGAGLDVFETEPLPPEAPIRRAPNLIITPHYAGWTPHYSGRLWELFLANVEAYAAGAPLRNVVDLEVGY
ncbi:MAG: D-2-hydroxyacid dehydrogenase [Spirochaetaceae bacterium]